MILKRTKLLYYVFNEEKNVPKQLLTSGQHMQPMLFVGHQTVKKLRNVNQTKWVDLLWNLGDLYSQSFISFEELLVSQECS